MDKVSIRFASKSDCEAILSLKRELAEHQNKSHVPYLTFQEWQRDGYDSMPPYFRCLIAETSQNQIVGYALYFYSYAAFEGKSLHLEDLCVSKTCRGLRIGSRLIGALAKIVLEEDLARITLEVADWNSTAIKFYEKHYGFNSTATEGWVAYIFERPVMEKLATADITLPVESVLF